MKVKGVGNLSGSLVWLGLVNPTGGLMSYVDRQGGCLNLKGEREPSSRNPTLGKIKAKV